MGGIRNRAAYLMGVLRKKVDEANAQRKEKLAHRPQRKAGGGGSAGDGGGIRGGEGSGRKSGGKRTK